jgi:raffinose/stachyose/melibiose transport system permease protein
LKDINAKKYTTGNIITIAALFIISLLFIAPILLVLLNSFKGKLFVQDNLFAFPHVDPDPTLNSFVGFTNYTHGLAATGFFSAFGWSLFITVFSVAAIVLFSAMTAWYITRSPLKFCKSLYFIFLFAMIVPFQMVMIPLTTVTTTLHLGNPLGLLFVYLGFGSAQAVFLFSGFVKSVPIAVEEAATIDGCTPIKAFFAVIFPMLAPIAITVAILNAMWIWNDFLMPYLLLDFEHRTIPIAIQSLRQSYGSIDWGYLMAMIIVAVIPIIAFYFACQRYIIEGVTAGSVKG